MSAIKIPAESTNDCDILYEKITSTNNCRTQDTVRNYCGQIGSNRVNCPYQAVQNYHCTCKLIGSDYPNYAADELSMFFELQSGVTQCSVDKNVPLNESIDLGVGILIDDSPTNYADPKQDSDSMDCQIIWARYADSSEPRADRSVDGLDVIRESEVLQHDPLSLPTSTYDMAMYLESPIEKPEGVLKERSEIMSPGNCKICEISLSTIYELKVHLLDHVNRNKSNADIYEKSVTALQQLDHRLKTGTLKRNTCAICQKVFLSRTDLNYHIHISHPEGRYQCQLCHKNYKRKWHLTRHEATHWKDGSIRRSTAYIRSIGNGKCL